MSQKLSLLALFLFRSSVSRSGFICAFNRVKPRPVGLVNVLGSFWVELEGSKDDNSRSWHQRLRLFNGPLNLALLQGCVFWAEGNRNSLGRPRPLGGIRSFGIGQRFAHQRAGSDSQVMVPGERSG